MKEELQKEYTNEETGMSYTLVGDYYMPNPVFPEQEKITLNKYGRYRYSLLGWNNEYNKKSSWKISSKKKIDSEIMI